MIHVFLYCYLLRAQLLLTILHNSVCCLPIHFHFTRAHTNEEPFDNTAQNFFAW